MIHFTLLKHVCCLLDDCPSGQKLQTNGSCTNCPRGSYRAASVNPDCVLCPANLTTIGEAATSSADCNIGKW